MPPAASTSTDAAVTSRVAHRDRPRRTGVRTGADALTGACRRTPPGGCPPRAGPPPGAPGAPAAPGRRLGCRPPGVLGGLGRRGG
ncbi:hypothetical protein C6N75_15640, partial [Streptomyces solincola]